MRSVLSRGSMQCIEIDDLPLFIDNAMVDLDQDGADWNNNSQWLLKHIHIMEIRDLRAADISVSQP